MKFKSSLLAIALLAGLAAPAVAQDAGGLYIAGPQIELGVALNQALAANPSPGRFYLLVLPPAQEALAGPGGAALRQLLATARERGGEVLICRSDIDSRAIAPGSLGSPVTVVRGWPSLEGGLQMIPGTDFYPGDDPAKFPPSHVQMRRLRSACS
ncbi:MAG: hypothetical protein RRY41_12320 [Burkholderiaceae bacterium]